MATELGNLGTDSFGSLGHGIDYTASVAFAINNAGTTVGYAMKFTGGLYRGGRPVRWDAASTTPTELDILGVDGIGDGNAFPYAINSAGTAVGYSEQFNGGSWTGYRAVRWDASGSAVTELGDLGTDSNGSTDSEAVAINNAGAAVGYAAKYTGGSYVGLRAVRWDASGTSALELGNLGTDSNGSADSIAFSINTAGAAVGHARKYTAGGMELGDRAVRWDASAPPPPNSATSAPTATEARTAKPTPLTPPALPLATRRNTAAARTTGGVPCSGGSTVLRSTSTRLSTHSAAGL